MRPMGLILGDIWRGWSAQSKHISPLNGVCADFYERFSESDLYVREQIVAISGNNVCKTYGKMLLLRSLREREWDFPVINR